jgi:hypothetical protein
MSSWHYSRILYAARSLLLTCVHSKLHVQYGTPKQSTVMISSGVKLLINPWFHHTTRRLYSSVNTGGWRDRHFFTIQSRLVQGPAQPVARLIQRGTAVEDDYVLESQQRDARCCTRTIVRFWRDFLLVNHLLDQRLEFYKNTKFRTIPSFSRIIFIKWKGPLKSDHFTCR